jgi:hypothetical protein
MLGNNYEKIEEMRKPEDQNKKSQKKSPKKRNATKLTGRVPLQPLPRALVPRSFLEGAALRVYERFVLPEPGSTQELDWVGGIEGAALHWRG